MRLKILKGYNGVAEPTGFIGSTGWAYLPTESTINKATIHVGKICHIKNGWYGIGTQAGSMSDLHLQFGMLPDHSSMPCRLHSHMYLHYQLAKKGYTPPSWNLNMELEPSPIGTVSRV